MAAFRVAALCAVIATAVHLAALTVPSFARSAYPPGYPSWRHALFVVIDAALAWSFWTRTRWLIGPYAVLTVQVMAGHGAAAWRSWSSAGHVAWIDLLAVVAVPLGLVLLIVDRHSRRDGPSWNRAGLSS
jgi:hypothetical protein